MAMRSGLFDSKEVVETVGGFPRGDKAETADFFAAYFSSFVGNGVYISPPDNFQVIPYAGLTVRVKPGKCFINGYFGFDDSAEEKTFATDTATHQYWLALRLDLAAGTISKVWITDPAAGTLPVRNAVIYDLVIARITVGAGAADITEAMISDLRGSNTYCGYVKSLVDGIGANVAYADTAGALAETALDALVRRSGDTMTGPLKLSANPTVGLHAATKQYVDARAPQLAELKRYTTSGTFKPADFPSAGNRYAVMLLGAGGSALLNQGTYYHSGGAGAMQFAEFIYSPTMKQSSFAVVVGAAANNSDGGATSFDCFIAPGGKRPASVSDYGAGGATGAFTGEVGQFTRGGNSMYGTGATASAAATGYGAGGFENKIGSGGLVIVYGYQ